jgi:hypothetical protein
MAGPAKLLGTGERTQWVEATSLSTVFRNTPILSDRHHPAKAASAPLPHEYREN